MAKRFKVKQRKVWYVVDTMNEDFISPDFETEKEAQVKAEDYEVSA